jgi:FHA domain/Domain of unknown function (DUF1707)
MPRGGPASEGTVARTADEGPAIASWTDWPDGRTVTGMTGPVMLPSMRASDGERDRALRVLRAAVAEGRLSDDSFQWRVDEALRARSRDELGALLDDLPLASPVAARTEQAADALARVLTRLRTTFTSSRVDRVDLPRDATRAHTLGRHPDADFVLGHPTVSRWHAQLDYHPLDGWLLSDLGSTNGTRLNGWRVDSPHVVRAGDRVTFGLVTVVLTTRR